MTVQNKFSEVNKSSRNDAGFPHSIDAEQALLGAIIINNSALDRVSHLIGPQHFADPLHGKIFEVASKAIESGKVVTPITLRTFFENHDPIKPGLTVPQYIGRLAVNATTTINARDYAVTVRDLAIRRQIIELGHDMVAAAVDANIDFDPSKQITAAEQRLYDLAERGTYGKGSRSLQDVMMDISIVANDAYMAGGASVGLQTGFIDLDRKIGGLAPGNLVILAGRPAMGKSALALNMAMRVAKRGIPVQFDSLEMSGDELGFRLLSEQAEVQAVLIKTGKVSDSEISHVIRTANKIASTPLWIDDAGGLTIGKLAARARRVKRQRGIGLLIIDYLQLMAGGSNNRVSDVTEITTGLKALAKELEIPIIALSQLSRQCETRTDKRPQLSDLRDSGSIEQDADIVMFVYRDEYYVEKAKPDPSDGLEMDKWMARLRESAGKAEVIVAKNRHGPSGVVDMAFDGNLTRFFDLASDGGHNARGMVS